MLMKLRLWLGILWVSYVIIFEFIVLIMLFFLMLRWFVCLLVVVDVDVLGDDWKFEYNGWFIIIVDEIVCNVLELLDFGFGLIIVFYDGSEFFEVRWCLLCFLFIIIVLLCIIVGLCECGLEFVIVDEMYFDEFLEWIG